jgi:hypothetical protein
MSSTLVSIARMPRAVQHEFGEHRLCFKLKTLGEYLFPNNLLNIVS